MENLKLELCSGVAKRFFTLGQTKLLCFRWMKFTYSKFTYFYCLKSFPFLGFSNIFYQCLQQTLLATILDVSDKIQKPVNSSMIHFGCTIITSFISINDTLVEQGAKAALKSAKNTTLAPISLRIVPSLALIQFWL